MSLVILDTNLVSALMPKVVATRTLLDVYRAELVGKRYAVSLQSVAELLQGAELASWGEQRKEVLTRILGRMIVLSPDEPTARAWSSLRVHARRTGRALSEGDAWIAATSVRWALPLITHDRDFRALDFPSLQVVCHAPE